MSRWIVILAAGIGLLLSACGSPSAAPSVQPTAAPPTSAPTLAPTSIPTAAPPTATRPAPTAAATASPVAAATASPVAAAATARPVAAPTSAPAASGGPTRWVLVPDQSEARFLVKEQLANRTLPNDAVGKTKAVSGQIVIGSDGKVVSEQSKFVVDIGTLRTDESRRDRYVMENVLEAVRFPNAEFVPTELKGFPAQIPTSGEGQFEMVGNMTIHGVTIPLTWQVTAKKSGDEVTGTATTAVQFGDFGMQQPRVAVVLSVEDNIRLELDFTFKRAS